MLIDDCGKTVSFLDGNRQQLAHGQWQRAVVRSNVVTLVTTQQAYCWLQVNPTIGVLSR